MPPPPPKPSWSWRDLEEKFGANWLNKLGVIVMVIGVAFFLTYKLGQVGPFGKVAAGFAVAFSMLGAGVFYESRERYRMLARAGIGGGWALTFFTTYAMHHVEFARVLDSQVMDLLLLLGVAAAMVGHTLRYNSQVVTGLAFLLAFVTVAISRNTVYSLAAGAVLALALVWIVLRKRWFQLEVFGLLASYLNHFFWLRTIIEPMGGAKRSFPEFVPSALLLVLYWSIFRFSYLRRKVDDHAQENASTLAAVLNSSLLLALMKYQSTATGLAFFVLIGLGLTELALAHLPVTRRRRAAFVILCTIGSTLAIAAIPFRYSGADSSILWLAEAQAFLLAGLLTREKLFRGFGLLAGALTGGHLLRVTVVLPGAPDLPIAATLFTCALVLYGDAHIIPRRWKTVVVQTWELLSYRATSYLAAALLFASVWVLGDWATAHEWVAVGWGLAALILAYSGWSQKMDDLNLQAFLFAMAAFTFALAVNRAAVETYMGMSLRLMTFGLLAATLYLSARWAGPVDHPQAPRFSMVYTSAGSACLAIIAYYEFPAAWVAVAWVTFALLLNYFGRTLGRVELTWHAHIFSALGLARALAVNLADQTQYGRLTFRFITLALLTAVYYALARLACREDAAEKTAARAAYSWAGSLLVALLIWHEFPAMWIAVAWVAFAALLNSAGRALQRTELTWQAHVLCVLAFGRAFLFNLPVELIHGRFSTRLVTVGLIAGAFYALSRLAGREETPAKTEIRHAYAWSASLLVGLLIWYELLPINVALAWAIFGLVLFELGLARNSLSQRAQGYLAMACAFARIFFVNISADGAPGAISPRLYTTLPIALIFFYTFWRTQRSDAQPAEFENRFRLHGLLSYLGAITLATLVRFELNLNWVIAGWGLLCLALLALAWRTRRALFLHQAYLLSLAVLYRTVFHNFYQHAQPYATCWENRAASVGTTVAALFLGLAFAFPLRKAAASAPPENALSAIIRRPEQWFFFLPLALLAVLMALDVRSGLLTVAWGLLAVVVFLFALAVGQRSYRLAGLALLLVCIGKILVVDVWKLEPGDRYLTFIGLGAAMLLISYLYTRYREKIHQYL
jgi:hypothetical protein